MNDSEEEVKNQMIKDIEWNIEYHKEKLKNLEVQLKILLK